MKTKNNEQKKQQHYKTDKKTLGKKKKIGPAQALHNPHFRVVLRLRQVPVAPEMQRAAGVESSDQGRWINKQKVFFCFDFFRVFKDFCLKVILFLICVVVFGFLVSWFGVVVGV